jgi:hypothetical protein
MDLKPKLVRGLKEGHFILTKGIIHQEKKTVVNIHASNVGTHIFIKQRLLEKYR